MTSNVRTVFVYLQLPGSLEVVTCGRISWQRLRGGQAVSDFVYGKTYRERRDAVPIDPFNLPVDREPKRSVRYGGLFGAIRDAAPDAWGRRVIERALGEVDLDEPDFLLQSPEDRAGALSFGLGPRPPPPVRTFNRTLDLGTVLEAVRQIEDDLPAPLEVVLKAGTSMGGARPKAVVRDGARLWLAKFPARRDRWNNARVEHAMLTLAHECGLRTPVHRVESIGSDDVLLIERFDRGVPSEPLGESLREEPTRYLRHRMVSALTVLGCDEEDHAGWSYLQLATELRRWVGSPTRDCVELFRRMAFNALVSNTDDHPRNHALIAPSTDWHLSPVYDVTPSPSHSHERDLAMRVGRWNRRATRANLLSQCGYFLLSEEDAGRIVDDMKAVVEARWRAHLSAAGVSRPDTDRVAPAFVPPGFEHAPPRA
jgi:serine/threonine-protein kinase HipA